MSLKALEILKKNRDFLLIAISYARQNGQELSHINFLQNKLSEHNEAIKELETIKHSLTKPLQEDTKLELDDTNQSAIYKIAGYESDGRE